MTSEKNYCTQENNHELAATVYNPSSQTNLERYVLDDEGRYRLDSCNL